MGSGVVTVCQAGFWMFRKIGFVEERSAICSRAAV